MMLKYFSKIQLVNLAIENSHGKRPLNKLDFLFDF